MANTVTPKLSSVGSGFSVKTYNYGGSLIATSAPKSIFSDYETIDYSYDPESHKVESKAHWYDNLGQKTGAFFLSAASSLTVGLVETLTDGVAILAGGAVAKVAELLGGDNGKAFGQEFEKKVQAHVEKNWSQDLYRDAAEFYGIDADIAMNSKAHIAGDAVGTIVGYVGVGILSGGASAVVMPVAGGLSAAGSTGQKALNNGATFNQALGNAAAAGVVGAASGAAMSKLGSAAKVVSSVGEVTGITAAGAAVGAATPGIQSAVEFNTYGKNKYSSYNEYAKATGTYQSMLVGGAIGGTVVGAQAVKSYASFASDLKKAGLTPKEAREIMKKSTDTFVNGSENNPHTEEAVKRNAKIARSNDYKALNREVVKHGKTLQEYGSKPNPDAELLSRAEVYAEQNVAHAKEIEPAITEEMHSLEDGSRKLVGLEHNIKGKGSMARKIANDATDWYGGDLEQAAGDVNDSVRYTLICDEKTMATDVEECMTALKKDGYKVVEFKNSYGNKEIPYKGINTTVETPDGSRFELQFHTEESFSVKEETTHTFYEIGRNKGVSTKYEEKLANGLSKSASNQVDSPYLDEVGKKYPKGSFVD